MRIKRFDISVEILKIWMTSGRRDIEVFSPIPKDAQLVRVWTDPMPSSPAFVSFYFQSESFSDLPEGTPIRSECITYTKHYGSKL